MYFFALVNSLQTTVTSALLSPHSVTLHQLDSFPEQTVINDLSLTPTLPQTDYELPCYSYRQKKAPSTVRARLSALKSVCFVSVSHAKQLQHFLSTPGSVMLYNFSSAHLFDSLCAGEQLGRYREE